MITGSVRGAAKSGRIRAEAAIIGRVARARRQHKARTRE
jgi:hypothetical protein